MIKNIAPTNDFYAIDDKSNWSITCGNKRLIMNNHGIKLVAKGDECLKSIKFDLENNTITVEVENPTLPLDAPRTAGLSDAKEFFSEIRDNIEEILTIGNIPNITHNEDRTEFYIAANDKNTPSYVGCQLMNFLDGTYRHIFHNYTYRIKAGDDPIFWEDIDFAAKRIQEFLDNISPLIKENI